MMTRDGAIIMFVEQLGNDKDQWLLGTIISGFPIQLSVAMQSSRRDSKRERNCCLFIGKWK